MRFDHLLCAIASHDGIGPKVAAYLGRRPQRMKCIHVVSVQGPKQYTLGAHRERHETNLSDLEDRLGPGSGRMTAYSDDAFPGPCRRYVPRQLRTSRRPYRRRSRSRFPEARYGRQRTLSFTICICKRGGVLGPFVQNGHFPSSVLRRNFPQRPSEQRQHKSEMSTTRPCGFGCIDSLAE